VLAELHFGVERLAAGRKQTNLRAAIDKLEEDIYFGRILPFDAAAAAAYGRLAAARERAGRRIEHIDAMIAAVAFAHRATLATRDVDDFADLGLDLINPFEVGAPTK
jgi:predicted nucleic acid-binding protein